MVRGAVTVIVLALVVAFIALNWGAWATPLTLSLGVSSMEAPLGLLVLVLLGLVCLLFAAWAMSMLAESHRQARELQAQRELADRAEASRFTELRGYIGDELQRLSRETRAALEQSGNSLAAQLGQLEDRIERRTSVLPPPRQ